MYRILFFIILFAGLWLTATTYNADGPQELAVKSHELFDMINDAREKEGVRPLIWKDSIANDATAHSVWMSQTDNYTHSHKEYAENIMVGCDPKEVFEAWDNSQLHHSNMLNEDYNYGAVGMGMELDQIKFDKWTITYETSKGYSTLMMTYR